MTMGFIWKKQLVLFVTLLLVIALGLTMGAFLHDMFRDDGALGVKPEVKVAVPSLPYPTTGPSGVVKKTID